MARTGYQYGTSPRKLEPDYTRKTSQRPKRKPLKVVKELPRQQIQISKEQRKIIESSSYANLTENSENIINCALPLALENIHEATNYTESCGGGGSPSSGWRREIRMMMTKDG